MDPTGHSWVKAKSTSLDPRRPWNVDMCCTTPASWLYASSTRKLLSWIPGSDNDAVSGCWASTTDAARIAIHTGESRMTNNLSEHPGRVRLDKWLWAARFYKTRGLSADAIDA